MKKVIIIGLGLIAAGVGLFIANRRGWFEGLAVFKSQNYIHTN